MGMFDLFEKTEISDQQITLIIIRANKEFKYIKI